MNTSRKIGYVPPVSMGPFKDPVMIAIMMTTMARAELEDGFTAGDEGLGLPDKCPYNMDQETSDRLNLEYRALLGDFTIKWGLLEAMLDNISGLIMARFDHSALAVKGVAARLPRGLERKLDFHKQAFRKIAALKPFENDAMACVMAVTDVRNERNTLIHGVLWGITKTGTADIWKMELEGGLNQLTLGQSSPGRIHELISHVETVTLKLADLSDRLLYEGLSHVSR